jgi:hypothetical protein
VDFITLINTKKLEAKRRRRRTSVKVGVKTLGLVDYNPSTGTV